MFYVTAIYVGDLNKDKNCSFQMIKSADFDEICFFTLELLAFESFEIDDHQLKTRKL